MLEQKWEKEEKTVYINYLKRIFVIFFSGPTFGLLFILVNFEKGVKQHNFWSFAKIMKLKLSP